MAAGTADDPVRIVLQALESLQAAGVAQLPKPKTRHAADPRKDVGMNSDLRKDVGMNSDLRRPGASPLAPTSALPCAIPREVAGSPASGAPPSATQTPSSANGDSQSALEALRREVAACTCCRELAATRKQTVFGVGHPRARLCFLGEAPGADEDQQGEPFVGKAGQLLNKIIEACTLRREQVYILNTIKCRPPGNRAPEPAELANCRGFLDRQLELIRPEFICCLGAVAARALLDTESSIGKLRGRFYRYGDSRVLCTYHPAYLLRNPAAKRDVWDDMQWLMREMGISLPPKP